MQASLRNRTTLSWSSEFGAACLGRITSVSADRQPWVDFPGNPSGPVAGLCLRGLDLDERALTGDVPVLLIFEDGDPAHPIIVGTVEATLADMGREENGLAEMNGSRSSSDNGRSLLISSGDEVTLLCGKSSITLTRQGRITLRGTEIVSRASGNNKIRGATVSIN
jgi:Domain of unknown function (DUF6484)